MSFKRLVVVCEGLGRGQTRDVVMRGETVVKKRCFAIAKDTSTRRFAPTVLPLLKGDVEMKGRPLSQERSRRQCMQMSV